MVVMDLAITNNGKNVENHVGRHGGAVDTSSRTRRTADQHISRDQPALPAIQRQQLVVMFVGIQGTKNIARSDSCSMMTDISR
jgi:hypothetical protein